MGHSANSCELRKLKMTMAEATVCRRCGEEGHFSNQCTSCPNCDEDHPPGSCPITKVTCFLCEGHDHRPKECCLHRMITKSIELQQRILHASIIRATPDQEGTQEHPVRKRRIRRQFDKKVTCFICDEPGHFAICCPVKRQAFTIRNQDLPGFIAQGSDVLSQASLPPKSPPAAQQLIGGKRSRNRSWWCRSFVSLWHPSLLGEALGRIVALATTMKTCDVRLVIATVSESFAPNMLLCRRWRFGW